MKSSSVVYSEEPISSAQSHSPSELSESDMSYRTYSATPDTHARSTTPEEPGGRGLAKVEKSVSKKSGPQGLVESPVEEVFPHSSAYTSFTESTESRVSEVLTNEPADGVKSQSPPLDHTPGEVIDDHTPSEVVEEDLDADDTLIATKLPHDQMMVEEEQLSNLTPVPDEASGDLTPSVGDVYTEGNLDAEEAEFPGDGGEEHYSEGFEAESVRESSSLVINGESAHSVGGDAEVPSEQGDLLSRSRKLLERLRSHSGDSGEDINHTLPLSNGHASPLGSDLSGLEDPSSAHDDEEDGTSIQELDSKQGDSRSATPPSHKLGDAESDVSEGSATPLSHQHVSLSDTDSVVISATPSQGGDVFEDQDKFYVGQQVLIANKIQGVVRYVGSTHFAPGVWVGVEIGVPKGRNDGAVKGRRYFTCEQDYGLFVPPRKLTVIRGGSEYTNSVSEEIQEVSENETPPYTESGYPRDMEGDLEVMGSAGEGEYASTNAGSTEQGGVESEVESQSVKSDVTSSDIPAPASTGLEIRGERSYSLPLAPEVASQRSQSATPTPAPPPEFAEGASRESSMEPSITNRMNSERLSEEIAQDLTNEAYEAMHKIWKAKQEGVAEKEEGWVEDEELEDQERPLPLSLDEKADHITNQLLTLLLQSESSLACSLHTKRQHAGLVDEEGEEVDEEQVEELEEEQVEELEEEQVEEEQQEEVEEEWKEEWEEQQEEVEEEQVDELEEQQEEQQVEEWEEQQEEVEEEQVEEQQEEVEEEQVEELEEQQVEEWEEQQEEVEEEQVEEWEEQQEEVEEEQVEEWEEQQEEVEEEQVEEWEGQQEEVEEEQVEEEWEGQQEEVEEDQVEQKWEEQQEEEWEGQQEEVEEDQVEQEWEEQQEEVEEEQVEEEEQQEEVEEEQEETLSDLSTTPKDEVMPPKNIPPHLVIGTGPPIDMSTPPLSPPSPYRHFPSAVAPPVSPDSFSPPGSPPRHLSHASAARVAAGERSPFTARSESAMSLDRSTSTESVVNLLESIQITTAQCMVPSERENIDSIVSHAWAAANELEDYHELHDFTLQCPDDLLNSFNGVRAMSPDEERCQMAYVRLVFQLALETIKKLCLPKRALPIWTGNCTVRSLLAPIHSSHSRVSLEELQRRVYAALMRGQLPNRLPTVKFLHKMRRPGGREIDFVDQILIRELRGEEPGWVDYSKDEVIVKEKAADSLLDTLVDETVQLLTDIAKRRRVRELQCPTRTP